ncbi:MAG: 1,4-alpha-glucan branching protein domain-containing protein [Thermoleophilaceae bacterium]
MTGRPAGGGRGALALVLHAHMPYVEGFGTWPFGEEWLFEAVATVYLPLLELLEGAPPVTLGLTPVLCDQLEALKGEAGDRFLSFLRDIRAPIHEEDAVGLERGGEPGLAREVRRAAGDYRRADELFHAHGRDLVGAFRELCERSPLELWTSNATHAVMPLLATDPGRRLQTSVGPASHRRRFGGWSGGFWLPECAYVPGLEHELAEEGVHAFCVDQTDHLGLGAPEQLEPVVTPAGPLAVPIDWQTVELIWGDGGYPGHARYRDYHGRTIHDLKPWNNGGEGYDHEAGLALAREHAGDFVARVCGRLEAYERARGRPGVLCCALDAELLGHWWYEGPQFLSAVLEKAEATGLELVSLPHGLERFEPVERELRPGSWGRPKDLSTWDSPSVAGMAFAARDAELRTLAVAAGAAERGGSALERAARELLAVQASDWAFLTTFDMAADYPQQRVQGHLDHLDAALAALTHSRPVPEPEVRNLAPDLDLGALLAP